MNTMARHRRAPVLMAAAVLGSGVLLAACGDDDDDDSSSPAKVSIEATGAKDSVSFTAPDEAPAGVVEIEFTNSSDVRELDGQLAYVSEEHTDEEVEAELQNAIRGEPVADWFEGAGGVGTTAQGETGTVTQELQEGTYYVVGGSDPRPPLTKFTVSGDGEAELPDADSTVTAEDYSFTGEGLKAGQSTVLLENAGAQWHHFIAAKINPGATIEDVQEVLGSDEPPQGPPPFDEKFGVQSAVLEGGTSQLVDVDLEPGAYAFFCFISDKQGGPPHVAKGMISEVTVSG